MPILNYPSCAIYGFNKNTRTHAHTRTHARTHTHTHTHTHNTQGSAAGVSNSLIIHGGGCLNTAETKKENRLHYRHLYTFWDSTHTHTHTHTCRDADTHTHTYRVADTHTYRVTDTHTYRDADTHTYSCRHTHTHTWLQTNTGVQPHIVKHTDDKTKTGRWPSFGISMTTENREPLCHTRLPIDNHWGTCWTACISSISSVCLFWIKRFTCHRRLWGQQKAKEQLTLANYYSNTARDVTGGRR